MRTKTSTTCCGELILFHLSFSFTDPSPPLHLLVTTQTSTSLSISWSSPDDPNKDRYQYNLLLTKGIILVTNITRGLIPHTFTNLSPGTDYIVSVSSLDHERKSQASVIRATTAPGKLQHFTSTSTATSITLQWEASQSGKDVFYQITYNKGRSSPIKTNETSFTLKSLSPNTNFSICITSCLWISTVVCSNSYCRIIPTDPSPPLQLRVATQNSTSLSISWTSPEDTNKNHYEYAVLLSKDMELETNIIRGQTNYTFANLSPGTDYNVSVSSLYHETKSQAAVILATTDPSPPLQLRVTTQNSTSLSISWTSPNDTNKDQYEYKVLLSKNMELGTNITIRQTNYTFTNLLPGTDYNVSVSSLYHERKSQAAVILATTDPSPPVQIRVTTQNSTTLSISWTSPNDTNKDRYEYNVSLSNDLELVTNITMGQTNYTFTNLSPGTDYNVSVSSLYNDTKSQATVIHVTTDPSPPLELRVTTQNSTTLSISWTSLDDTNKDRYQYNVLLSNGMELETNITIGQTNYTFTNLSPGTDYDVSVSSLYNDRKSQATATPATTDPSSPSHLSITAQSSTSFSISWTRPNDTNESNYQYNVSLFLNNNVVKDETTNGTHITFTKLLPGTTYSVTVRSEYNSRESQPAHLSLITDVIPPTMNFSVTQTTITLRWEHSQSGNAVFYKISFELTRSSVQETNDTSLKLTGLRPKTQYNISISACLQKSGKCSNPNNIEVKTETPVRNAAIIGGVFGGLILAALLIISFLVLRRHFKNKENKTIPLKPLSMKIIAKIPCSNFEQHYQQLHADSDYGFAEQYEMLKNVGKSQPRTAGQLPSNLSKNRYKDIVPYDDSRVCLMVQDNEETSDYINASYIAGFSSQKEFIASQGPLPSTVVDFWRMVWEQKVSTIVMLAQCVEAGRPKCEQYWPDDKQPHNYGKFIISLLREDNVEHWIVRALEVRNSQFTETRQVSQYHFQCWPDHGVPNTTTQLIDFVSVVRTDLIRTEMSKSTVVHCSAGVGRTGTFIALDQAIQQIEEEDMVELNTIVKNMRRNRCMMVQTEVQYKFLHTCVRDYLKSKSDQVVGMPIYQNTAPAYQDQNSRRVYENMHSIDINDKC
uniref:protein-tyrosine-phosphatase n=1 Tax=Eptatretus burgeri TaxID=7764 RepID=A0A8C4Q2D2_EPTBU